jgi:sensitive to high expression protein 9
VKARRLAIDEAKQTLDSAHAQQGSSQKEVVALLERKHSWSATDLERYMALIRSEHINDQAVNRAKEAVQEAENALEEARSHLEKRERAQYHEEQIWSDTIRRNSTWVTFGLMGLNIFLLLASLVAIEPWRRSKMVKEIRRALDAQKTAMENTDVKPARAALPASPIDAAVTSAVRSPDADRSVESTTPLPSAVEPVTSVEAPAPAQDIGSNTTTQSTSPGAAPLTLARVDPQQVINIEEEVRTSTIPGRWDEKLKYAVLDLVSERTVSVRKIDFTTAIFQAATVGAVISAALIAIIRLS